MHFFLEEVHFFPVAVPKTRDIYTLQEEVHFFLENFRFWNSLQANINLVECTTHVVDIPYSRQSTSKSIRLSYSKKDVKMLKSLQYSS